MKKDILDELKKLKDEENAKLVLKLCKEENSKQVLGIRIPKLRLLAKKLLKEWDSNELLNNVQGEHYYLEETILEGLIIGYSKIALDKKLVLIKNFIPKITNWLICDTFCPTIKIKKNELKTFWNFLKPYLHSKKEFYVRFGIVMLLDNYVIDDYVDKVIIALDKTRCEKYYASMAKAWTLAEIGIKYQDKLMSYLEGENHLDTFTYNKTLQKMLESYRINDELKNKLRKMKRKDEK